MHGKKTLEKVLSILIFMELKIKITRYHFIITKMAKLKTETLMIPNTSEDPSNWYHHLLLAEYRVI